jgi:hypothetical protein
LSIAVPRENGEPPVEVLGGPASELGQQYHRHEIDGPADSRRLHLGDRERRAAAGIAAFAASKSARTQAPLPLEIDIRGSL